MIDLIEPKINWKANDVPTAIDFNRIERNTLVMRIVCS